MRVTSDIRPDHGRGWVTLRSSRTYASSAGDRPGLVCKFSRPRPLQPSKQGKAHYRFTDHEASRVTDWEKARNFERSYERRPHRHPDRGGSAYLAERRRSASASAEPRRLNGSPLAPIAQCLLQRDGVIPLLNCIVERIERDRTTDGALEGERKQ